jgi:O-antigen/teichoic acid export membrane protein
VSNLKKDLAITFATEALVLLCGLLTYKEANLHLGHEGFSVYALCRRTHSLIFPALAIGATVAIPRYIAFNKVKSEEHADNYFKAGVSLLAATTLLFVLVANAFPAFVAQIFFNDTKLFGLVLPLSVMMAGYACHSLCYAYYRGHTRMHVTNALQLINVAIVPLLAAILCTEVRAVLLYTGVAWLAVAGSTLLVGILPRVKGAFSIRPLREIFGFGIQRVPADFGAAALLGLPATLTAHCVGVVAAGHVAFGISLLNMSGAVFAPIGLVLLPKASAAIACKEWNVLKKYMKVILVGSLLASLCGTLLFEAFARQILTLYLGTEVQEGILSATRVVMVGAVPYGVYVASRSIIDAFFNKSLNALNIVISLVMFVVLFFGGEMLGLRFFSPVVSLVAAMYLLGLATVATCAIISRRIIQGYF